MEIITFTVPGVPIGQPKGQPVTFAGHARIVPAPRTHPIHAFRATVRLAAARAYQGPPLAGPVSLFVSLHFPRPKSRTWKRRPMPPEWHDTKPDSDNCIKAIKDSLKGLLWRDDCQVALEGTIKVRCGAGEGPETTVTVQSLAGRPVLSGGVESYHYPAGDR